VFHFGHLALHLLCNGGSNYLMKLIPKAVKVSTIVGMGLQIALLGMMSVNLVVKNDSTLVSIGSMNDVHIWMALCGLVLTASHANSALETNSC
jgi:AGZA family xanthine/uracil permease-like MFS transporter